MNDSIQPCYILLAEESYLIDAIRERESVWKTLDGTNDIDFSDFPNFHDDSCWDGAVLTWYPYKTSTNWPYGSFKCEEKENHFDAICISLLDAAGIF